VAFFIFSFVKSVIFALLIFRIMGREISFFHNLLKTLFGSPMTISIQQRYFNAACFFAALATLLGTIVNFSIGLNPFITISTLFIFLAFSVLYLLSKKGISYQILLWSFSILFYILFTLLWFTNSGSKGPTVYSFFIFIFVINLVFGGKKIYFLNASFILLLAGLFIFEKYYPDLIMGYQNETQRFDDHFFTALFELILLTIIVAFLVRSYYEEKESVERQRDKIIAQNKEMLLTEQELERYKNNLEELVAERTDELKKVVIELEKAKKKAESSDKLKTVFLANMSHEIRTPMNAILGFSDLLKKDINPDKKDAYIKIIQEKGQLLLQLINDIVDVAKIESDQMEIVRHPFDFEKLIDDVQIVFSQRIDTLNKPIIIKIEKKKMNYLLVSDEIRIKQVLYNLVDNAIKYTDSGEIIIAYTSIKNWLEINISDTGIGISEDKLQTIFNRFERVNISHTKPKGGTGLGLSISKKLAELLGGQLSVKSELGKGTTFTFRIPFEKTDRNKIKETINLQHPDWQQKSFLVAEDEEANYLLIKELLSETKAKLIMVKNGQEVIDYLQQGGKVDIILMDIQMPVMDGYQTLEVLKKEFPNIPVVAQTAYAFGNEVAKMKKIGFVDVILKPIEKEKLIQTISKILTRFSH